MQIPDGRGDKSMGNSRNQLWYLPVILWMGFIFYMSSRTGEESSEMSGFFVELLLRLIGGDGQQYTQLGFFIRKGAHMTEYAVLYFLFYRTPCMRSVKKTSLAKALAGCLLFCFLYAISDEAHQLMVSDRAGRATDVLIDTAGAAIAMAVCLLCALRRRAKREKAADASR